jgi:F-type H+-transporting ATPase subunit delta
VPSPCDDALFRRFVVDFGIAADHVPSVAELKPGLVSITNNDSTVQKYFISGGFVFVHDDSTCDLSCVEAVPIEHIDPVRARNGVDTYSKLLAAAPDELSSAKAQIGLEVHEAMVYALDPSS